jgi:hypothetical protein
MKKYGALKLAQAYKAQSEIESEKASKEAKMLALIKASKLAETQAKEATLIAKLAAEKQEEEDKAKAKEY